MERASHYKNLRAYIGKLGQRHGTWEVFTDFLLIAAVSFSNVVDLRSAKEREAQYMETIKKYSKEDLSQFAAMLAELTLAMEDDPSDILGKLFHELDLGNKWRGQFFTPDHIARMMAEITINDGTKAEVEEKGFITALEPALGSGVMVINLAQAMLKRDINPQQTLLVTGVDVDLKCVHMAYIQLTLLHIPAVIVHGNSLTLETFSTWYTPAYVLGGWAFKKQRIKELDNVIEMPVVAPTGIVLPVSEKTERFEIISLFG